METTFSFHSLQFHNWQKLGIFREGSKANTCLNLLFTRNFPAGPGAHYVSYSEDPEGFYSILGHYSLMDIIKFIQEIKALKAELGGFSIVISDGEADFSYSSRTDRINLVSL